MESFARPTFIINPRSAGGATQKKLKELEIAIKAAFNHAVVKRTDAPGAASRLADEARREGADLVVVVGGDGSTNEVVDGLMWQGAPGEGRPAMPTLGIIPQGTGCDLAKSLGLTRDVGQCLKVLKEGDTYLSDVGRIECRDAAGAPITRHFINIASMGISGEIVNRVNRSGKALGGLLTFGLATVGTLLSFNGNKIRVRFDDREPIDTHINVLFVCNAQYCGGGMRAGKGARMDDGLFKVIAGDQDSLLATLPRLAKLYSGDLEGVEGIHVTTARRLEATALGEEVLVECDGEQPGKLPAVYEVLPGRLPIRVGPGALTLGPAQ